MTMAFSTDTLLNRINEQHSTVTKTQMNNKDLNLEKSLRTAASETVKFLLKRNANSDTNNNSDHYDKYNHHNDDSIAHSDKDDNDVLDKSEYATTAANNLSATITSIRSNVNKVLYMYFQNKTDSKNYSQLYKEGASDGDDDEETINYKLTQLSPSSSPLPTDPSNLSRIAKTMTSEILQNSTYENSSTSNLNHIATTTSIEENGMNLNENNNNVILTTMTHLNKFLNATAATTTPSSTTIATNTTISSNATIATTPSITYPSIAINSYENCSALFANYTQPHEGEFSKRL